LPPMAGLYPATLIAQISVIAGLEFGDRKVGHLQPRHQSARFMLSKASIMEHLRCWLQTEVRQPLEILALSH